MTRTFSVCLVALCVIVASPPVSSAFAAQATPAGGQAQETRPPAAAPRQGSAAQSALNQANAVKDLDQKIAALRKVAADFPKTRQAESASGQVLAALVKKGDPAPVREQAAAMVAAADDTTRGRVQRDVAAALLRGGEGLLDDAENYAVAAAAALPDEKGYVEARTKEAAARGTAAGRSGPPTEPTGPTSYVAAFKRDRQSVLSTLGEVYVRRGKVPAAERTFREVYLADPKSASAANAALKLADYAKAAGRDAEQYDYLAAVAVLGRLTPSALADFQAAYRKAHNGSLDGLEEMLDARYEKEGPHPPAAARYQATSERTGRLVLAELFTGSGCPPCVAADLAFESAMHRYDQGELAVLMYHLHVPRPDPMTNPYTQARSAFYAVPGVPTMAIDGKANTGGGPADYAAELLTGSVAPAIDKRMTVKPGVALTAAATLGGGSIKATATLTPGDAKPGKLRLHLVLVEERIRYSGENGVRFHPMVVRSMASTGVEPAKPPARTREAQADEAEPPSKGTGSLLPVPVLGFAVEPGQARTFDYTFDLAKVAADGLANLEDLEQHSTRFPNHRFVTKKHEVDRDKLWLVAFAQDEETKEVLQAVKVKVR
jgi:hypothetical protein